MRFLIAPDSFKGTLTASDVADVLADAVRRAEPSAVVTTMPLADGGEGTLDALQAATGARREHARVTGMLAAERDVPWLAFPDGATAMIEAATCIGLHLLPATKRDPSRLDSAALGLLLRSVIDAGRTTVYCTLGGTATNDCGLGFATALGFIMNGDNGGSTEKRLARVSAISDESGIDWRRVKVVVLSDVTNPLLGTDGCTRVFGPQKGVAAERFEAFEHGIAHFADVVRHDVRAVDPAASGSGAAGGLGFALRAFCNADVRSGAETVLRLLRFDEACTDADIVMTGEGRIDAQSTAGKLVSAVAAAARKRGKPVVAFCGSVLGDERTLCALLGLADLIPVARDAASLEESLAAPESALRRAADAYFATGKAAAFLHNDESLFHQSSYDTWQK